MNLPVISKSYPYIVSGNSEGKFGGATLFIKGGDSPYILPEHKPAIIERFPNAKVRLVPGTGHWLHAEKPELVTGILMRFRGGV